jgi:signal transduction histidine kinase
MFSDYSISKKLTVMNVGVSGAALTLACAAFIAYDAISLRQGMVENLSTQAQIAGFNSNSALLFNDSNSAENTLSALGASPNIISAGICTPDGRLFAAYQRRRGGQVPALPPIPPGEAETHRFTWSEVVLVRQIVFQDKLTGIVYLQSDLQRLKIRVAQYLGIAAAVLMTSLLAVLLISPVFRRAIAEPIVHLAGVARIVSRDKDYSVRATPTRNRDELAGLIETFNGMLSQIQERDAELQLAHDQLEERVEERTRELAATNKEPEAFAYSVSHDLRAPLRGIDGFSQALLEDYSDRLDSTGRDYLDRVRRAAQRMSCLIDDMLALSRVTRSQIHRENLDLSAIARSIAEELRRAEPVRIVEFEIEEGLTATGDSQLLRAALENLIRNSWKYTSAHPLARIEFGKVRQNGKSPYFVRDDGAGFDPRYTDRLFGAFQRLHTASEFPGTGVGLATVQRIIHRHGGEIWAEGAVERGATFYFTL